MNIKAIKVFFATLLMLFSMVVVNAVGSVSDSVTEKVVAVNAIGVADDTNEAHVIAETSVKSQENIKTGIVITKAGVTLLILFIYGKFIIKSLNKPKVVDEQEEQSK